MSPDEIKPFATYAEQLALKVLSRDNAQISNGYLTRAAMTRFKSGLRALEAYLRRFLLFLALQMEPELKPNGREYAPSPNAARLPPRRPVLSFRDQASRLEDLPRDLMTDQRRFPVRYEFPAHHLLARLSALRALIAAPEKPAQRLAYQLARKRPGLICPPGNERDVPRRYGTEVSALYDGLAARIIALSRERPDPLPPVSRAPPRIRIVG